MFRRHLMLAALATLALPTAISAAPQWGVSVQLGSQPSYEPAFREGYERGVRAGEDDSRRGNRFQFNDESDYRRGDYGYRSQYGNRDWYRNEFRRGFEAGYNRGYRANGGAVYRPGPGGRLGGPWPNGRGGNTRYDLAIAQGFTDGYEAGLNDGEDRNRFDPISESRYRSGDRGYERAYGPRELYRDRYRDGFRQGYDEGYADGSRYGRR